MPIPRKPTERKPVTDERDIDALIERGGSVAVADEPPPEPKEMVVGKTAPVRLKEPRKAKPEREMVDDAIYLIQLRLLGEMVKRIDRTLIERHPHEQTRPPRHAWLVEACLEKLEREEAKA